jgi:uncharacterized protein YhaN
MKIKRMTASFGRLDHQTLELKPGLNVLTLPNEGGKSTWCAFLRVMLYGLNTRERDKKGFLADKSRYLPWNGAPMEGELLLEWQGRDILVRRSTKGNTPMGVFSAIYADTGEAVPGLNADNLGDVLTGVSRSVFERSAFLGQAALPVTQTPELEKRLSALVSSGEEGVSATQAREVLTEWQHKRRYRGKGVLSTMESRRAELEGIQDSLRDLTSQIRDDRTEIKRYEDVRIRLKHQVDLYEAREQTQQAKAYAQAQQELRQAQSKLEKLRDQVPPEGFPPQEELEQARDEVALLRNLDNSIKANAKLLPEVQVKVEEAKANTADPVFSEDAAGARARAQNAVLTLQERRRELSALKRWCWLWPLLFAALALAPFGYLVWRNGAITPTSLLPLVNLIIGIVGTVVFAKRRKRCAAQMQAVLAEFHATADGDITAAAEQYCSRLECLRQAEEELARVRRSQEERQSLRTQIWERLRSLVDTFAPEVKDVFGFSAAVTRALTLLDALEHAQQQCESSQRLFDTVAAHGSGSPGNIAEEPSVSLEQAQSGLQEAERRLAARQNDLSMALGRQSTLGDPDTIRSELESLERQLQSSQREYDALTIALEALDQADAEMRDRFSPELNRRAGAYLERLTEGKYAKLRLNRALEAGAEEQGSVVTRDVLTLSRGTVDQLWLAVRLAVCDLALPQEDGCPLILDDALVNFDDERAQTALALLQELSQQRQILLFSCHSREERLLQTLQDGR